MEPENGYFPTGIVTGFGFCDREKERAVLKNRLKQNAHVVMMSPRRYGKSSLIAQFTLEQNIPFISIDLLPATSSKYVKNAIVDGVGLLLDDLMSNIKKTKEKILNMFSSMNPVIELSALGQKLKLTPQEKTPEEVIMKLLLHLDKLARDLNKKIIFVIDEFQQIATLEDAHSLEASIRHAVERSKNVFYVFSGSNRTLLEAMFKSKERPLYHLCDEIKLNRIDKESYSKFIIQAAVATWKTAISNEVVDEILDLTGCHPYYLNRLCRVLWDEKSPPSEEEVKKVWNEFVEIQVSDWVAEIIGKLSVNQKTILAALAKEPEKELSGKNFLIKLGMSPSSIQRTISTLIKEDFIYKDHDDYYQVLNPVIKTYLFNNNYFDFS